MAERKYRHHNMLSTLARRHDDAIFMALVQVRLVPTADVVVALLQFLLLL